MLQASNPGQFEGDADMSWMRGKSADSIYHMVRRPRWQCE